jgi:predicted ATPase
VPRYVLTGAPGAGKTAILRLLERSGYRVVEEAATDVIALELAYGRPEAWRSPGFADAIAGLQRQRREQADAGGPEHDAVFFDRSPVCTLALCRHLDLPVPALLAADVDRVVADGVYGDAVFFVRNQGFVEPTAARRISFQDSLAFERVHEQVYRALGFELIEVAPGPVERRATLILEAAGLAPLGRGWARAPACSTAPGGPAVTRMR